MTETVATAPDPTADDDRTLALVANIVRGLTAYRQETLLYPPEHPRLVSRLESLYWEFTSFMAIHRSTFTIQVREGTLFSSNLPLSRTDGAVKRLATLLRERMVQLVQLREGVTQDEISGFVQLLLCDPTTMIRSHERRHSFGPNLELYRFDPTFSDTDTAIITEEEILHGETEKKSEGSISDSLQIDLSNPTWKRFDRNQLSSISRTLDNEALSMRFEDVRAKHGGGDGRGKDFLPAFFEILRLDPRTDWDDVEALRQAVAAGLVLLEETRQALSHDGAIPVQLLTGGSSSDQLTTNLRWRLVRHFFPGMHQERSPRDAEDLSFRSSDAEEETNKEKDDDPGWRASQWELTEIPEDKWGETDPETLTEPFADQFENAFLLDNYVTLVAELLDGDEPESRSELEQCFFDTLLRDVPDERVSRAELDQFLPRLDLFPENERYRWRSAMISRIARAEDVIHATALGDEDVIEELLTAPPKLEKENREPEGPVETAKEVLRRVLHEASHHPLDVCLAVLGHKLPADQYKAWTKVAIDVARLSRNVLGWIEHNIEALLKPEAVGCLTALPLASTRNALSSYFGERGTHLLQAFLTSFPTVGTPSATELIYLGLETESPSVRSSAIAALGRQGDSSSLQILEDELDQVNRTGKSRDGEVEALCTALSRHTHSNARSVLERVLNQKRAKVIPVWRRDIRTAAKNALAVRKDA